MWTPVIRGMLGWGELRTPLYLDWARREDRVVVTLDADFHSILAMSSAVSPSVIRLRIEGVRASDLAGLVLRILQACTPELESGAAVSADGRRIRIKRLPLLPGRP